MTAVIWKDKQDVQILINMSRQPAEGNFCEKHGKAHTSVIVEDYSQCMGCVDKGDRMATSCSVSQRIWKLIKRFYMFYS
jgi:hypothetical protein